jgi:predicted transcriptional regulator
MSKKVRPFEGGFFAVHNGVFDVIMPRLSANGWKVLCVAIRQTMGWVDSTDPSKRRERDIISYSQFMEKAGIGSRHTVSRAVNECLEAGYLIRHEAGRANTGKPIYAYSLNTEYELTVSAETAPTEAHSAETAPTHSAETAPTHSAETAQTKRKKTKQTNDDGDNTKNQAIKTTTLTAFGVARTVAQRLAGQCTLEEINGWIEQIKKTEGLRNPVGFLVSKLRAGEPVPEQRGIGQERRPDSEGKYAKYIQT